MARAGLGARRVKATNAALLDFFMESFAELGHAHGASAARRREAQALLDVKRLVPVTAEILRECGEDPSVLDEWLEDSRRDEILRRCQRARELFAPWGRGGAASAAARRAHAGEAGPGSSPAG